MSAGSGGEEPTLMTAGGAGGSAGSSGSGGSVSPACSGAFELGECWYLGAAGQSCTSVCAEHGGVDLDGATAVGIAAQGGSRAECATLLAALGVTEAPTSASRADGQGLGCHLYNRSPYWLTSPQFAPAAKSSHASLVCSCRQ